MYWPIIEATSAHAHWRMSRARSCSTCSWRRCRRTEWLYALIFSRVPFYEYYTHVPRLIPSLTPVIDQTIAGAVLMILGKATLAVAAIAVFTRWFGADHRATKRAP